ncbi:MAG TPA: hypothetical protein VMF31_11120 [Solirubrobacterales bacterium]|nr:hypothetical protein [Solirubrobacterales bacterium]
MAEPQEGQLTKIMEQRAYTRIGKARDGKGRISKEKIEEVAEVVDTQVRLARELGAECFRAVATAAIRDSGNAGDVVKAIEAKAGIPIEIVSGEEEGRLAFIGATKALGHPIDGSVAVVDVGGGSTEITFGTVPGGVNEVISFAIGSGALADELIESDPPSASEIRKIRDRVEDEFKDVKIETKPDQVVAVGGSATSLRRLTGVVLEYETLERGIRVLCGDPAADVAKQFELDPVRVRILPTGVLILEKLSELLGQPLQIGKGGIREGIVLDMLNDDKNVTDPALAS